jgi:lisH domain-containing protein FOPNL
VHAAAPFRRSALRLKLEHTGALRRLRAQLRADVTHALENDEARLHRVPSRLKPLRSLCSPNAYGRAQPPPSAAVPDENLLVNELIREYLQFNGLTSTLSVLLSETGAPAVPLDRPELATLVGVVDDAHSVRLPLLYELTERSRLRHAPQPQPHAPPPPLSEPTSEPASSAPSWGN